MNAISKTGVSSVSTSQITRRNFVAAAGIAAGVAAGLACAKGATAQETGASSTISAAQDQVTVGTPDETITKKIVIVGAGCAGMMAAYEAGKAGVADVLVVSNSQSALDTNGSMVSGTSAVETSYTKDAGETETIEELFQQMVDFAHWTANARLLKTCTEYLPGNIEALQEMGIDFELGADRGGFGYLNVHLFKTENKGDVIQKYLEDNFGTEFMYGFELTAPVMDGDAIKGVQGTDSDGKLIEIDADAVLLACGGYMDNKEMLAETYGDMDIVACTSGHLDGMGIKVAKAAGAFPESVFGLGMNDIFGSNATLGFNMSNQLLAIAFYGGLLVNETGERFTNEYMVAQESMGGGGESLLHAKCYYTIISQTLVDALKTQSYYDIIGRPEYWHCGEILYTNPIEDIDDLLTEAQDLGWVIKADTLPELAEKSGLANLEATVEEYNEMAEAGVDDLFYKPTEMLRPIETDGPLYLIAYNPGAFNTFGGCRTDRLTRALRADFSVIDGLYIAGVENGSLYSRPYYEVGGSCSGLALSSGRLAGQQMAAYVQGK
jgi:fumarate reductase flavoprotein subunit